MFNNVNRLNYFSPIKKTVTNKIKHLPYLFALSPKKPIKQKCHHFLPWSTMSTNFVTIIENKLSLFTTYTYFKDKIIIMILVCQVTLIYTVPNQEHFFQGKVKQYFCGIALFCYRWITAVAFKPKAKRIFSCLYFIYWPMRKTIKLFKWLSKAIILIIWFSSSVQACIIVAEHKSWVKFNLNVLYTRFVACIIRFKIMLLKTFLLFKLILDLKISIEKWTHFLHKWVAVSQHLGTCNYIN